MFVQPHKNMFEILRSLREAEEDDAAQIMNTGVDQNTTNTDATSPSNDGGEAESASDDDLNLDVDLNLDDPGTGGENNTNTDNNNDTESNSTGSTTNTTDNNEEVKKGNTDLFASLTAEEQSIKIMELKKLYNDLYFAVDDLHDKLADSLLNNIDPRIVVRITSQVDELRRMIQTYIIDIFPIKTYYENDVSYSIFLNALTTLQGVFEEIYKNDERNHDKK